MPLVYTTDTDTRPYARAYTSIHAHVHSPTYTCRHSLLSPIPIHPNYYPQKNIKKKGRRS